MDSLSNEQIRELLSNKEELEPLNLGDGSWIAWAAGFFDGEGAVIINRNNSTGQIAFNIQACQKERAPLEKLASMFGSDVKLLKSGIFEWRLFGQKATRFLAIVRPYLLVKGAHADLAIEFYERCNGSSDRELKMDYYWRMQALQKKGQHLRTGSNAVAAVV